MLIPEYYIEDENTRLEIYQRLSKTISNVEIESIQNELLDRFGKLPDEVEFLLAHVKLKLALSLSPFTKSVIKGNKAELFFDMSDELFKSGKFEKIITHLNKLQDINAKLKQIKKTLSIEITLRDTGDKLYSVINFVETINSLNN